MGNTAQASPPTAIEIRFGQVGIAQARLHSLEPGAILDELTGRVATAPHFFERAAVCVDLSGLDKEPTANEVRVVCDTIRRAGMMVVGLAHGTTSAEALARELDLPVLTQFRPQQAKPAAVVQAAPVIEPAAPTLMHHQPVRSGQRVYARNRDLIVTASVGAGAEVMSDGCVHIYGVTRGRVMAGARGEMTARVFCQEFHAELVSIAGVFRVFETIPAELAGKPVQAWLDGDDLRFAALGS